MSGQRTETPQDPPHERGCLCPKCVVRVDVMITAADILRDLERYGERGVWPTDGWARVPWQQVNALRDSFAGRGDSVAIAKGEPRETYSCVNACGALVASHSMHCPRCLRAFNAGVEHAQRRPTATGKPDPDVVLSAVCDLLDNMSGSPIDGYLVPDLMIDRLRAAIGGEHRERATPDVISAARAMRLAIQTGEGHAVAYSNLARALDDANFTPDVNNAGRTTEPATDCASAAEPDKHAHEIGSDHADRSPAAESSASQPSADHGADREVRAAVPSLVRHREERPVCMHGVRPLAGALDSAASVRSGGEAVPESGGPANARGGGDLPRVEDDVAADSSGNGPKKGGAP